MSDDDYYDDYDWVRGIYWQVKGWIKVNEKKISLLSCMVNTKDKQINELYARLNAVEAMLKNPKPVSGCIDQAVARVNDEWIGYKNGVQSIMDLTYRKFSDLDQRVKDLEEDKTRFAVEEITSKVIKKIISQLEDEC